MADTTNISDLPGQNVQQGNQVVQSTQQGQQMQQMQQTQPMQQIQQMHQIQPMQSMQSMQQNSQSQSYPIQQSSHQNITMDVTYNPNNVQTINPQIQQNNMPQLQNQQISQPNMTYNDVVKSVDNKGPETLQMNNGNTMTNILQNMEQIAKSGAFDLPSRDIPIQENNIDIQSQANYIPEAKNYINEYESQQEISNRQNQIQNKKTSFEIIYDKLQIPMLLGLLYFVFHLPVINKFFYTSCSFCFHKDGNMNFNGYLLKSIIFASMYFGTNLLLEIMNKQFV